MNILRHVMSLSLAVLLLVNTSDVNAQGACSSEFEIDLPLLSSTGAIDAEIQSILNTYAGSYLGTSAPSQWVLDQAKSDYEAYNITVNGDLISGNTVASFTSISFLKTFAQHLWYNPDDSEVQEMANNTVWLVCSQLCNGVLAKNVNSYSFRSFAVPAAFVSHILNSQAEALLAYAMEEHGAFHHFWVPEYNPDYNEINGAINTDYIYNVGLATLVYSANQSTADLRYLWMRGLKRWVERFTSYTYATLEGIKVDGSGFHHRTAYDDYMYAYNTASAMYNLLAGSTFEPSEANYLIFRDAIYAQLVIGNELELKPLSMAGRNPQARGVSLSQDGLKNIAIAGGKILGLNTADPILAGNYNRIFGVDADFNYTEKTPIEESNGFFQFNFANAGVFRKSNWLVTAKGFSDALWGSEIYVTQNRYGRYQSYGAVEVIYEGDKAFNSYDPETWNWNYNPGATTIVLPWEDLHGERGRVDEFQEKPFAGALAFKRSGSEVLSQTHGQIGVWGMDFQQSTNLGWGETHGPDTHNETFTFKKSVFTFDDVIVCLGSNINNDDVDNPTVTTLFQRRKTDYTPRINGRYARGTTELSGSEANFFVNNGTADFYNNSGQLDNYKTGFYLVEGNDNSTIWFGEQQTPNQDQVNPTDISSNEKDEYWIGYINHGTNPVDAQYEYMMFPNSTTDEMSTMHDAIQSEGKAYTVHQKDQSAHILEHKSGVWGYVVFENDVELVDKGLVKNVSSPSLIMYEASNDELLIAVSDPDLQFSARSNVPTSAQNTSITLEGTYSLSESNENVDVVHTNGQTVLDITTFNGLPEEVRLNGVATNVETKSTEKEVSVYPNPISKGKTLYIETKGLIGGQWNILTLGGILINKGDIHSNIQSLDCSTIGRGMYILKISDNNGVVSSSKISII